MNHLTELELSTLADGEALSEATAAHVAECPECNEQLGLALLEGTSLQMAMQHPEVKAATYVPFPTRLVALAAAIGVLGLLQMCLRADSAVANGARYVRVLKHAGPLVAKGLLANGGAPNVVALLAFGVIALLVSATLSVRWAKA